MRKKHYYIIAIVTVTLLTTGLHFITMRAYSPYVVLEELYYLPLLLGVLRFGVYGAVVTWLFVSAAYLPFFFAPWTTSVAGSVDRFLHLSLSGVIAFVVGLLVERERRQSEQVQRESYLAGIGRVATVIVHDLKNPLISILGFSRRISEGKGESEQAAAVITESAQTMQRIVNEVLDFAKPMQLDLRVGAIGETIDRVIDACQTKARAQGVLLKKNVAATPCTVAMDGFHVERALVNLVDNAIDASGPGQQVLISAELSKRELVLTIKDQGRGMSRDALAHLFEPFFTTKNGGTGLGMPIARKIITEHGGTLTLSSRPEVGTEATVRLPRSNPGSRVPLTTAPDDAPRHAD